MLDFYLNKFIEKRSSVFRLNRVIRKSKSETKQIRDKANQDKSESVLDSSFGDIFKIWMPRSPLISN